MNTYASITKIAMLAISLVAVSSCKKYLDQQPITAVGTELVFKDVNTARQALAGVYSRLVGDQAYGIRISLYYPVDNDEMQGPTGALDNDRRDIARYEAKPGNAQLERPFNQLFTGIEYANICIDNIPKMNLYGSGTENEKKQLQRMLGEAMALRAQYYFEAIRNWGDLPAHFKPAYAQASENPFPARMNRDSLYDNLLADLKTAATLVPWRGELATIGDQEDERLTKGTIKGLRARLALFRAGYSLRRDGTMLQGSNPQTYYQIAKEECTDIINSGQHALNPSYRALWKDLVCGRVNFDPGGELMFQASGIGANAVADTKLGYYNGPTVNNLGNKSINPLPTYFYLFDSTDLRRDVTIAPYNVNADGSTKAGQAITALNDGKYRRDWFANPVVSPTNAVQYFSTKWQILRYADVLLMLAEAENELNGPTSIAYDALNKVRRRGYGKPIATPDATVDAPTGLSKADFFKFIVRERALELGGEGIRKYDLIRWNLLTTALAESKANMLKLSNIAVMDQPTYMAGYPSYCMVVLPIYMYFNNASSADNFALWRNSFYKTAPTSTPSGTTRVNWIGAPINTVALARYATGYQANKSQLLPIPQASKDANINMYQNFGY